MTGTSGTKGTEQPSKVSKLSKKGQNQTSKAASKKANPKTTKTKKAEGTPRKRAPKRKETDGAIVPVQKEELDLITDSGEDPIGQYTKAKRLCMHVLEKQIELAGESGLVKPVIGDLSDPEGATAESLGLVPVADLRYSKKSIDMNRIIAQAMMSKEFGRGHLLMQLLGKKTLGMDMVHAARFLANSNNNHSTAHLVPRTEAQMLEVIREDCMANYPSTDGSSEMSPLALQHITRSFELVGRKVASVADVDLCIEAAKLDAADGNESD